MGKLREKASATNVQSVIKEISDFTDTNLGAKLLNIIQYVLNKFVDHLHQRSYVDRQPLTYLGLYCQNVTYMPALTKREHLYFHRI